jgi:hypothetical protein
LSEIGVSDKGLGIPSHSLNVKELSFCFLAKGSYGMVPLLGELLLDHNDLSN